MSNRWLEEHKEKYGVVPEDFIEEHLSHCHRIGHGISGKRHCAVSLWYDCKDLGIKPAKSHFDLPRER